jgi:hypothetical protein
MPKFKALYRHSFAEAKRLNELEKWRQSHNENIRCRDFLDEEVRQNFDGMHLNSDEIVRAALDEFGYDRTMWVLANHVQLYDFDGRFTGQNKAWAQSIYIQRPEKYELQRDPYLRDPGRYFLLYRHNALVDGLVTQVQKMYAALNLYDHRHRVAGEVHQQDFKDRLLILRADVLNEASRTPENQLFLANIGGFGCTPNARGRAVMGHFLIDGERANFDRADFVGIVDEQDLPDWAQKKLQALTADAPDEGEVEGMKMKGM